MLLVLMDSSALCAKDPDYFGTLPAQDSLYALHTMKEWKEQDFVSNAKYWKDWPLARFLRNPPPNMPSSWLYSPDFPLFAGDSGVYFRRLANYSHRRKDSTPFYRAVYGISQSKRGFAQVPPSFVAASLRKHSILLSTPPPERYHGQEDVFDISLARRFIATFLQGFEFPKTFDEVVYLEGSTAASVYTNRSEGGTRESLRQEMARHFQTGATPAVATVDQSLRYHSENPKFVGMSEASPGHVLEVRSTIPISSHQWRQILVEWESENPVLSRLPPNARAQLEAKAQIEADSEGNPHPFWNLAGGSLSASPFSRVAAILEPLKVRTITAMDPLRSHVSRPLQKALWSHLRTFEPFVLVGEPISESILHDFNLRHRKLASTLGLSESDHFVSGDYSAATDGLDIRLSKLFLESLLEFLPSGDELLKSTFRKVLLEQVILYPPGGPLPILQKNGQLMGSVLSFPFLCLANMFTYIVSLADGNYQRAYNLLSDQSLMRRLPVLINGDDILFRASPLRYRGWLSEIKKVGFVPSVGKNFFHPRFLTVNSVPIEFVPRPTTYEAFSGVSSWPDMMEFEESNPRFPPYLPDTLTDDFKILGFINVGLLTGQAKLTGRDSLRSLPISGWHAQSVLTSINPPQAHKWFLHYHRSDIQRQTQFGGTTLNIFAHPLLGGLGFVVPPGVEPRFSPEQRRIASALSLSASATRTQLSNMVDVSPLISVSTSSTGAPLLGHRKKLVEVQPYPVGMPLAPGRDVFVDLSMVSMPPLSVTYGLPPDDTGISQVRCRLTGRQIRSLTKRFGQVVSLHPVEKMTSFGYILVTVDSSVEGQGIYSPENFFQDVPTTQDILMEELPFASHEADGDTIPPVPTPVTRQSEVTLLPLEDWETEMSPSLPSLDPEEVHLEAPDYSFVNRGDTGRKRRRLDLAVANAYRPGSYQY